MTKKANLLKGFETEAVKVGLLEENGKYYYKEVGMLQTNEHETIKEFNCFEKAIDFYGSIFLLLKYNNVKILKTF